MRQLVSAGLHQELAKESVDYIREQIHAEIEAYCKPQFERVVKLQAKIGYRSVSSFTLLALIFQDILPDSKQKDFNEVLRKAKAFSIEYLKSKPEEFAEMMISEQKAIEKFNQE